ncbi:MAG: hypothetical protein N3F03_07870 [Ignavibacteria bacterium]|nr:hypothetical protein [Ignavibacteria bacterium]
MINLAQKILLYIHSKQKSRFQIFSPLNVLKNSQNVLILLPDEKEIIQEIKFLIPIFNSIFKQKSFLVSNEIQTLLNLSDEIPKIVYSKEQKNFIKLPTREFIKFLQLKNFDTIIDCNLGDSIFHYWITKNIDAKFKIGLYRKNSTLFNNLVMKVRTIDSVRTIYENFIFLLKL